MKSSDGQAIIFQNKRESFITIHISTTLQSSHSDFPNSQKKKEKETENGRKKNNYQEWAPQQQASELDWEDMTIFEYFWIK